MKAIIPIAGLGTRLFPLTKVIPKAMLPVAGKPCVQWIVEELSAAGIKDIIFVTSKGQEMVQKYFAKKTWYEEELMKRGKKEAAAQLEAIRNLATFHFVKQDRQLGDGHAILQAKKTIGDEAFLVFFGDCLYTDDDVTKKLEASYQKNKSCVIAVQGIAKEEAKNYGIAEPRDSFRRGGRLSTGLVGMEIEKLVEKPATSYKLQATSYAIIGRYLLTPSIWKHLEKRHSESGEVRLIDALQSLQKEEPISAIEVRGVWLDTGTFEGLEKANKALSS